MTNTDGARWYAGVDNWELCRRERDGGAVLGRVALKKGSYFWVLGDAPVTYDNEAPSLYAAQRAVRKALKQEQQP